MESNNNEEVIITSEKEEKPKKKRNVAFTIFACIATAVIVALSMNIGYNLGKMVEPKSNNTENDTKKEDGKVENNTEGENSENNNNGVQEESSNSNGNIENNVPEKEETNEGQSVIGTYINLYKTDNVYHDSKLVITNQTESTIDFSIETANGKDKNNVNIGSVEGTAQKVVANKYVFEEALDDEKNSITFEFSTEDNKVVVNVSESYSNNVNPYAGAGVNFAGKYQ